MGPKTIERLRTLPFTSAVPRLLEEGAGKSEKVPPGLLRASGLEGIRGTSTSTTTPPTGTTTPPTLPPPPPPGTGTSTATTSPPVIPPAPPPATGTSTMPSPPPAPAPDITPPTVAINNPVSGVTVSGNQITILATLSDNVGVTSFQFTLDGANFGSEFVSSTSSLTTAISYWL